MPIVGTGPQFPVAINPPAGRDGAQSAVDAVREQGRRGDPSGRLQRRASARDEVPRQAAAETVAERRAVERETGAEGDARRAAAGRPSAAFLAQLIAQSDARRETIDDSVERLRARRRERDGVTGDDTAEARNLELARERRGTFPEQSVDAYRRTNAFSREFVAQRYQVLRDADGVFIFQSSIVDIST